MTEEDVRPGFWFKPKAFGYGATPATWQGWLVVALFVLLTGLTVRFAMPRHPLFLTLLVPLTLALIWISWAKTDGGWRWRP
ncbi:hypothetical protein SAMN03159338_3776 [Sphingomonas sp. NFR04]|uniref:hypothetical protein n=1 Tax=Sphingomonas sp. NFR04 TaxID=1566283 RepID=UPI0008E97ED0|nr:hypothetical protein [Sphingomonas sp. NFR04]SFK26944.1 hypothetical protein SAMN03159338_3776 [Sphingomonas sp. NFR04]